MNGEEFKLHDFFGFREVVRTTFQLTYLETTQMRAVLELNRIQFLQTKDFLVYLRYEFVFRGHSLKYRIRKNYSPLLFLSTFVPNIWSMLYTLLNADGVILSFLSITKTKKKITNKQQQK